MEAWAGISKSSHMSQLLLFQVPEIMQDMLFFGIKRFLEGLSQNYFIIRMQDIEGIISLYSCCQLFHFPVRNILIVFSPST